MLWHCTKISLRSLSRQKLTSFINVFSLSLGIAAAILIYLFIQNEQSFDNYHANSDKIYRINRVTINSDKKLVDGIEGHPMPFTTAAKNLVPEIDKISPIYENDEYVRSESVVSEENFYAVSPDFLDMFDFERVEGNLEFGLDKINDVILTESLAEKHFGDDEAVGQILNIHLSGEYRPFRVTTVLKDPPPNSTFQFDLLLPFEALNSTSLGKRYRDSWRVSFVRTFVQLHPEADREDVEQKLTSLADEHFTRRDHIEEMYGKGSHYGYQVQPLNKVHFDTFIDSDLHGPGDEVSMRILGFIGLIILFLACVNFAVLAIGRGSVRTEEIALRKVVGAQRSQLIQQFLGESFVLSLLSLAIGLGLASIMIEDFAQLANRNLTMSVLVEPHSILFLFLLTIFSGLLAGFYPAIYLSRFSSIIHLSKNCNLEVRVVLPI